VNSWAVPIFQGYRDKSRLLLICDLNIGKVQREVNGEEISQIALEAEMIEYLGLKRYAR
jgi:hypothetical protein